MKHICDPWLINPPFEDPGLYVDILGEKRSLLFDLGSLNNVSTAKILSLSDVFISHTHIDHFIGFDHLLRLFLMRKKTLRFFGPPGLIKNINGKLQGYIWNLVDNSSFVIEVHEIHKNRMLRSRFICAKKFCGEKSEVIPFNGVVLQDPLFTVECAVLDHRIPSVAFSIQETDHINVSKDAIDKFGFTVGPWLNELKKKILQNKHDDKLIVPISEGDNEKEYAVTKLKNMIATVTKGQKISYVVDVAYHDDNVNKIISLVRGSEILYIEAMFSSADSERGKERYHLTSKQAGEIAREAGVGEIRLLHHSARYMDEPLMLSSEAKKYFTQKV